MDSDLECAAAVFLILSVIKKKKASEKRENKEVFG